MKYRIFPALGLVATLALLSGCGGSQGGLRLERDRLVFNIADLGELETMKLEAEPMEHYEKEAQEASQRIKEANNVTCKTMNMLSGIDESGSHSKSAFVSNMTAQGYKLHYVPWQETEYSVRQYYTVTDTSNKTLGALLYEQTKFEYNSPPFTMLRAYLCRV
ncbi:hypothetical protein DAERI_150057 [Deinococcus aerius]|uniref:Lipoprotein n=1 Tax=Deinococcus aerius TaxID=200253 RepID=A0A2I9CZA5_9DEIO|nr:hypothetical protein [Deinococcus aerius]GBF07539.1 hypothetical protein DAERI_150057 [Deinococcus aerius]